MKEEPIKDTSSSAATYSHGGFGRCATTSQPVALAAPHKPYHASSPRPSCTTDNSFSHDHISISAHALPQPSELCLLKATYSLNNFDVYET